MQIDKPEWLRRGGMHFLMAGLLSVIMVMPDGLLQEMQPNLLKPMHKWHLFIISGFTLLIIAIPSFTHAACILLILGCIQLVQLVYTSYFGTQIVPEVIHNFLSNPTEDSREVYNILVSGFSDLHIIALIVIASYAVVLLIVYYTRPLVHHFKLAAPFLYLIMALFVGHVVLYPHPLNLYPDPAKPSLYNALNTMALYLKQSVIPHKQNQPTFLEYEVRYSTPKANNIVLIMGESTNPDYMSLFGYNDKTTPLLDELKNDHNFIYRRAFAGGVYTVGALKSFFNLALEPGNDLPIIYQNSNLFKLAKHQGYTTVLISVQTKDLLARGRIGLEFIDHFVTIDNIRENEFTPKRDMILPERLSKLDTKEGKYFIVLHMRSQHTPYECNYSHMPQLALHSDEEISKISDSHAADKLKYINSMRFNDLVINEIIQVAKLKFKDAGESYVFFTSDHGELLGENNLYGHSHMGIDCAKVPLLVYGINPDLRFLESTYRTTPMTHYDLGLMMANLIGVAIHNPNTQIANYRYVQGIPAAKFVNYLQFQLDGNNKPIDLQKSQKEF